MQMIAEAVGEFLKGDWGRSRLITGGNIGGHYCIPICTCINSVRKILGNQIVFTPSTEVIPFSKYLSFHLGVYSFMLSGPT